MAKPEGDDLSDMLSQLAKAQQSQEAELSELVGASASRSSASGSIEELSAEGSAPAISSGTVEVMGTIDDEPEAVVTDAAADKGDAPVMVNAAVEELYAVQHANDEAEDPLAALAMEAGGAAPPADGMIEEEVADVADAVEAPALDLEQDMPVPRRSSRSAAVASRGGRSVKPTKPAASLQAVFAPVLITFGLLTLIPAIWAVLVLMGMKVPMHDGQGASGMAKLMLVCWPVSLGLLAGGIVGVVQTIKQNRKQKEREAAPRSR